MTDYNVINRPPFQPLRAFHGRGKGPGTIADIVNETDTTYQIHHVSRTTGAAEYCATGYTARELRNLANEIWRILPNAFVTCDFCGADMGENDNPNECNHPQGKGGAAGD